LPGLNFALWCPGDNNGDVDNWDVDNWDVGDWRRLVLKIDVKGLPMGKKGEEKGKKNN
jgi:hypothetical protein